MKEKIFSDEEIQYLKKEGFNDISNKPWFSTEIYGAIAQIYENGNKPGKIKLEFAKKNLYSKEYYLELRQENFDENSNLVNKLKGSFSTFEEFKKYWKENKNQLITSYKIHQNNC